MIADARLKPFERMAANLLERINERPGAKTLQRLYHRHVGRHWVYLCTRNLLRVDGLGAVARLAPERGVLLCANHRSFFDQYVVSSLLLRSAPWVRELYFPVRSGFFYETWTGVAVNLVVGGGAMYPPIYRDPRLSDLNLRALETAVRLLERRGTVLGMHPEGTRGKGPDPYALLPAQPGVGRVAVRARATVLPVWIRGLGNDFVAQVASNFTRRGEAIHVLFGAPVDLDDLQAEKPRLSVYKRAADRILEHIRALGERERAGTGGA